MEDERNQRMESIRKRNQWNPRTQPAAQALRKCSKQKLLNKKLTAQAVADPFAYEAYIEKKKQEKIEAQRSSRITIKRKLPKVNRLLAARILENQEQGGEMAGADDPNVKKKSSKKNRGLTSDILKDDRFTAMFENQVRWCQGLSKTAKLLLCSDIPVTCFRCPLRLELNAVGPSGKRVAYVLDIGYCLWGPDFLYLGK
ncbi:hypothetical protein KSP40_PGU002507 [Platanthera guangdongensis]|uniref:Uncharacterized protein n=1 Tax=Platanthera guangdongensis TaxID=2320717 RepID=A0ABR2M175_9ASPA